MKTVIVAGRITAGQLVEYRVGEAGQVEESTIRDDDMTATEIAALLGVKRRTFLAYVYREQAPAPYKSVLGRPIWHAGTITNWIERRKGTPGRPRTHERPATPGGGGGGALAG